MRRPGADSQLLVFFYLLWCSQVLVLPDRDFSLHGMKVWQRALHVWRYLLRLRIVRGLS